jgi:hypothetical protein
LKGEKRWLFILRQTGEGIMSRLSTSVRLEIEQVARQLSVGDRTEHYLCPLCRGGQSGENSFVVWSDDDGGGYGWNCYRASCGVFGFNSDGAVVVKQRKVTDKVSGRPLNPYKGTVRRISREEQAELLIKIGFRRVHESISGVKFADQADRFAFPILDPLGERRGLVLRSWKPGQRIKAVNRMEKEEPSISWYYRFTHDVPLIIVEDIPSAVRASVYCNAVALLGTNATQSYMYEILKTHTKEVVWAFDADASTKAIKYAKENRALFAHSRTHILSKDLKDMSETEIESTLSRITTRTRGCQDAAQRSTYNR